MLNSRQKFIKRIALRLALVVFIGLFVTDLLFVPRADSSEIDSQIKIISSQIADTPEDTSISGNLNPRIDSEAAMIERVIRSTPACWTLPGELWIFLLVAYLFLLFFNLFYDFEKSHEIYPVRSPSYLEQNVIPTEVGVTSNGVRWFWESLYTLLALWGWYVWDACHESIWFPLYVIKLGTIVYLVYLYLFYKQKELQPLSDEDLENFEG